MLTVTLVVIGNWRFWQEMSVSDVGGILGSIDIWINPVKSLISVKRS